MDTPGSKNVPGIDPTGNSHMSTTSIVHTLESDKVHRRALRNESKRHFGEGHSYPIRGFGTGGELPPGLKAQMDKQTFADKAAGVLARVFKVGPGGNEG